MILHLQIEQVVLSVWVYAQETAMVIFDHYEPDSPIWNNSSWMLKSSVTLTILSSQCTNLILLLWILQTEIGSN